VTQKAAFLVDNPAFATLGAGRWHGVPYSGMLLVGFMVAFGLILARTTYGEAVYAVGGNYEASRLSGLRVRSIVTSSYVLLGACVARIIRTSSKARLLSARWPWTQLAAPVAPARVSADRRGSSVALPGILDAASAKEIV
jgi:ribose/xylose/arabinose/galactoside ABC-type transport system permease subunit